MSHSLVASAAVVGLAIVGVAVEAIALPTTALAAPGPRVCPAEGFWIGEGWGAERGRRSHTGIDLGGTRGSRLFAIEDGVIDRTKRQSNGALQIVLRGASGAKFYYGHMDTVLVMGGQRVTAGEVIGRMGDSGSPGAVHLHFEFWRSGGESAAVDPEPLIRRVCERGDGKPGGEDASAAARDPQPAPPMDPAIQGDVFQN